MQTSAAKIKNTHTQVTQTCHTITLTIKTWVDKTLPLAGIVLQ